MQRTDKSQVIIQRVIRPLKRKVQFKRGSDFERRNKALKASFSRALAIGEYRAGADYMKQNSNQIRRK